MRDATYSLVDTIITTPHALHVIITMRKDRTVPVSRYMELVMAYWHAKSILNRTDPISASQLPIISVLNTPLKHATTVTELGREMEAQVMTFFSPDSGQRPVYQPTLDNDFPLSGSEQFYNYAAYPEPDTTYGKRLKSLAAITEPDHSQLTPITTGLPPLSTIAPPANASLGLGRPPR